MNNFKKKFIKFIIKKKALKFGTFKLKSGKISPYFFNSSVFKKPKDIIKLSEFYTKIIINSKIKFNLLFGFSYKGIPIVISTIITLFKKYNINIPYCFNRKEKKKHGEKGKLIGSSIKNKKIIILDDVLTSGITIQKNIKIFKKKAKINAIIVAFDRQEKKKNSIIKKIQKKIKIITIININDIIKYLKKNKKMKKELKLIINYNKKKLNTSFKTRI
ncbi:orotate phosphoribosyltransferase [Buchnera aphidicola]|uniref:orotate phosphoribosyltransferase n=1 Tax=Buchnera aphidicola TaxID=9 RepID=UPI0031B8876C